MPKLTYACVLTRDIDRLGAFYRAVLQLEPRSRGAYLEFQTPPGILSLWSLAEFERVAGTTASEGPASGSVMLEFQVDDVDAEYTRLRNLDQVAIEFVMQPTTLPWGNRSIHFRDPDGTLVNFFSRTG
jgi:catechol 2,3-dioxygenase-like lactoylglutathione lyase family enzyme